MKKQYRKILSAGILIALLLSVSLSTLAEENGTPAAASEWVDVETVSRGNLVVGDGSAVSIRSEDIRKLSGSLNALGSDYKAAKKDLGSRLSSVESEIEDMKTSFLAGVNELCEELEGLECAPADRSPAGIREQLTALSQKSYDAGYSKGCLDGQANADPGAALSEYVFVKSFVDHHWDSRIHTTILEQNVTVYRVSEDGKLDISPSKANGEIYNREGCYSIEAKCTTDQNLNCLYKDCLWPGYEMALVTLQRDAKVRIYKKSGMTEQEYKAGETFQLMDEEAFLML